jgi:osmotically-inducible protein OsmY
MRVFAICLLAGCATVPTVRSSPSTVAAYEQVRSGEQPSAQGGDVQFCAGPASTIAQRTQARPSDNWTNQFTDHAVASSVRGTLRADPALADSPIAVSVEHGAVDLEGNVPSAAVASHAIARALQVEGVVMVQARLFTPEEPNPPPAGSHRWCG